MREPGASWSTILVTVGQVEASLHKWLSQHHGLGLTDYRALTLLSEAPARELRISELAEAVGLTQSSTTRLVERLEAKGFVERDTCPDDGRGIFAVITDVGLGLAHDLVDEYRERLVALLGDVDEAAGDSKAAFHTIGDFVR